MAAKKPARKPPASKPAAPSEAPKKVARVTSAIVYDGTSLPPAGPRLTGSPEAPPASEPASDLAPVTLDDEAPTTSPEEGAQNG